MPITAPKNLLFVDLVIGRYDAESLVAASNANTLTHLITTNTEQGREDFGDCLKQLKAIDGPFDNIGFASNGPEIPLAIVQYLEDLYTLVHPLKVGSTKPQDIRHTNLHFFGSYTRINNAFATVIKTRLQNVVDVYVSTDRTGNPSQNGNWILHEINAHPLTKGVDISDMYFDSDVLSKVAATFEAPLHLHRTGYHHGHGRYGDHGEYWCRPHRY